MISGVVHFRENILGCSRNVSETAPRNPEIYVTVTISHTRPWQIWHQWLFNILTKMFTDMNTLIANSVQLANDAYLYFLQTLIPNIYMGTYGISMGPINHTVTSYFEHCVTWVRYTWTLKDKVYSNAIMKYTNLDWYTCIMKIYCTPVMTKMYWLILRYDLYANKDVFPTIYMQIRTFSLLNNFPYKLKKWLCDIANNFSKRVMS